MGLRISSTMNYVTFSFFSLVSVDPTTVAVYTKPPVPGLLSPSWLPKAVSTDGWWNLYGRGRPKYELVTVTFDAELAAKKPEVR